MTKEKAKTPIWKKALYVVGALIVIRIIAPKPKKEPREATTTAEQVETAALITEEVTTIPATEEIMTEEATALTLTEPSTEEVKELSKGHKDMLKTIFESYTKENYSGNGNMYACDILTSNEVKGTGIVSMQLVRDGFDTEENCKTLFSNIVNAFKADYPYFVECVSRIEISLVKNCKITYRITLNDLNAKNPVDAMEITKLN